MAAAVVIQFGALLGVEVVSMKSVELALFVLSLLWLRHRMHWVAVFVLRAAGDLALVSSWHGHGVGIGIGIGIGLGKLLALLVVTLAWDDGLVLHVLHCVIATHAGTSHVVVEALINLIESGLILIRRIAWIISSILVASLIRVVVPIEAILLVHVVVAGRAPTRILSIEAVVGRASAQWLIALLSIVVFLVGSVHASRLLH